MTDSRSPAAGWYPDPEHRGRERWWNGVAWSDARRAGATAAPDTASTPSPYLLDEAGPYRPDPYREVQPVGGAATGGAATGGAATAAGPTNGLATGGLVVAIAGLFVNFLGLANLVAIALSIMGLVRARALAAAGVARHGRGAAIAGIVLGAVGLVFAAFWVLVIVAFLFATAEPV